MEKQPPTSAILYRRAGCTGGQAACGTVLTMTRALIYVKRLLQRRQRLLPPATCRRRPKPHFAGVDHADVDAALGQGAEHAPGHAGVRPHADAEHEQLGDVGVGRRPGVWDRSLRRPRPGQLPGRRRRSARGTLNDSSARPGAVEVLHDHVHDDAAAGHRLEDPRAIARPVRQVRRW